MRTCRACGRSTPWIPGDGTCDLCRKRAASALLGGRLTTRDEGAELLAAELATAVGWGFDLYDRAAAHGTVGSAYVRREGTRLLFTVIDESGDPVAEYVATVERHTVELVCGSCGTVVGSVHPPAPPVPVVCSRCRR